MDRGDSGNGVNSKSLRTLDPISSSRDHNAMLPSIFKNGKSPDRNAHKPLFNQKDQFPDMLESSLGSRVQQF